jgi:hypothetical protein
VRREGGGGLVPDTLFIRSNRPLTLGAVASTPKKPPGSLTGMTERLSPAVEILTSSQRPFMKISGFGRRPTSVPSAEQTLGNAGKMVGINAVRGVAVVPGLISMPGADSRRVDGLRRRQEHAMGSCREHHVQYLCCPRFWSDVLQLAALRQPRAP